MNVCVWAYSKYMRLNATQTYGKRFLWPTLCFPWLCVANKVLCLFHTHTHAFTSEAKFFCVTTTDFSCIWISRDIQHGTDPRDFARDVIFEWTHVQSDQREYSNMSAEPGRKWAYSTDIRLRIVYQQVGMGLHFYEIANNLNIATSTTRSWVKGHRFRGLWNLGTERKFECNWNPLYLLSEAACLVFAWHSDSYTYSTLTHTHSRTFKVNSTWSVHVGMVGEQPLWLYHICTTLTHTGTWRVQTEAQLTVLSIALHFEHPWMWRVSVRTRHKATGQAVFVTYALFSVTLRGE